MASLVQPVDWTALTPVLIPAALAVAVLVADLFLPAERKPLLGWVTAAGLAAAALTVIPLRDGHRTTFCQPGTGGCSYAADHFTLVIQVLVLGGALLTALLSIGTLERMPAGEYWFLLLSSAAGAALLPASRDLATLIVALEVTTLPAFALVGLRRDDRLSSEAALKFFLTSVTATAVSLLGISFVYAATGTLQLNAVAAGLTHTPDQLHTLARAGVALTLVGFAFKLAVAPFQFWVPDTYAGAPLPVAAYLSVVGKAAGFSGLILVTVVAFRPYSHVWGPAIGVLAALTMTVGNVGALRQRPHVPRGAVRLLAWSSIGQAGYLLVPLAAAASADDPAHEIGTTVAYALMYAVVNLGAFAVVALVERTAPHSRLTDYRGLYAARPAAALALAFFLLCLAGLPPGVIGLFAKVAVFSSAVGAQHGWLAVIMAVNVVIALVYYLRWTALLFTAAPERADAVATPAGAVAVRTPAGLALAVALTAVAGVALSGAPQLILRYAQGALL
ncbi:NADH-quinone oxidoreductase subunit N [Actinacidiphila paucisporea]|uniref:NADH-quinone oxidoreductase subunit N n=1 Tax=Actinacidiphila paucisporea TaxID=310782 RepID=A0A1M6TE38_9ACTN|nr:NADH-quinone oxidoreductase subunit N [Actinacidiphila paucisporea]SHK55257.1 NADH dehydrogenase subunit N [Actinacidiphila paucisporea]